MKVEKYKLASKINMIKGIVPKKTTIEALQGILVDNGYLIANNMETAAKVKLEGTEGEQFIIPARAFDLINNLPDGQVEITASKQEIVIKTGKIRNKFMAHDAEGFSKPNIDNNEEEKSFSVDSEGFLQSLKRVSFAIPSGGTNQLMQNLCLKAKDGKLNYIGLDGHMIAWDKTDYDGDFELLIPKNTVDKLMSIGLTGEIQIKYNKNAAMFVTDECEISTRLFEGTYFDVNRMMIELPVSITVRRQELLEAMSRAKMCSTEDKAPVKFTISGPEMNIETMAMTSDYSERLELVKYDEKIDNLIIAFNSHYIIDSIKVFRDEEVELNLSGPKTPVTIRSKDTEFVALILPVKIQEEK